MTRASIPITIPTLNQSHFLGDALASVRVQGFPSVEHIGEIGASKDDTVERLRRHSEVRWVSRPDPVDPKRSTARRRRSAASPSDG